MNTKIIESPLTKHQACGCVICTCESAEQCQGCGAKHCGTHPLGEIPNPQYEEPVFSLLVRLYNAGYTAGHHDTVENQYTDIFESEMETYHEEIVTEFFKENAKCDATR